MDADTDVDGIPARVVELTGEPGDMAFCHPTIVHSVASNRGSERSPSRRGCTLRYLRGTTCGKRDYSVTSRFTSL